VAAPTPGPTGKSLFRNPIFWASAAGVIVLIAVVAAVAGSNNHKGIRASSTTTTAGATGSTGSTGTTGNTGTTGGCGAPGQNPCSTPQSSQLGIGGTEAFSNNGSPFYNVTVTQFVNPAQPANQYVTPQNAGDKFVAVAFTVKSTGNTAVSDDIYNDTKLYDSTGQGFEGNFEDTASGPGFPSGEINVAPGGTASGWVMFEVPGNASGFTVTFTPSSGFANQAATTWKLG
jgi:hypothetical protein